MVLNYEILCIARITNNQLSIQDGQINKFRSIFTNMRKTKYEQICAVYVQVNVKFDYNWQFN